jgi:alpha-beta hydrolase superfamily lysophospholipase
MSYLINNKNQRIAYKMVEGRGPGIVFIHGLKSDMNGLKAVSIQKYAKKNHLSFLRFDCRGNGKSDGKFEDFSVSEWKEDIILIIDKLTKGPQILIGSSLGGWLMMLAAKARPKKIAGLIGLAATTDFGDDYYNSLDTKNKNEIKKKGITKISSSGFSYFLKSRFFVEATKNNVLNMPFKYNKPFILIHGLKDDIVNPSMPKKILANTTGSNVQIIYLKSSDHRLSEPKDLITINNSIDSIRCQI